MRKFSKLLMAMLFCQVANSQNVGIGTSTPSSKLHVVGTIRASNNVLADGYVGIGTTAPNYKLQVVNGSFVLENTLDAALWKYSYSSSGNYLNIDYNGSSRLAIQNGGNVGIGTTAPVAKLDVAGSLKSASANIGGALTVNNGDGVLRNGNGSQQLKYYKFTNSNFHLVNFAAFKYFGPVRVNFPGGAGFFSSAPTVVVANYTLYGGTAGILFSIIPTIFGVDATGFDIYFYNASNSTATIDLGMTFVCVGPGN